MDPAARKDEYGEEDEAERRMAQKKSEKPLLAVARRREEKEVNKRMLARTEKMARVQGWVSPEAPGGGGRQQG